MSFIKEFKETFTRTTVQVPCPVDYLYKEPKNGKPLLILFHGYQQTGKKIHQLLEPTIKDDWGFLSLNGPYPFPYQKKDDDQWRLAFSWYFYDTKTETYFIDHEYPASVIKAVVEQLGHADTPKISVGFSQGGYLSPFASLKMKNVLGNIALNGEYKHKLLPKELPFPIFNICGAEDFLVDPKNCQNSFNLMIERGNQGEFIMLPDTYHNVNQAMQEKIVKLFDHLAMS